MQLTVHPSQSLRIAMLLTLLGGYLDSFALITFTGHLASLQSGNLILMGISFLQGHFTLALSYILPITCFLLGAGLNYFCRHLFGSHHLYYWQEVSILIELAGFLLTAILAPWLNQHGLIAMLAFFAAIQADTSTTVHNQTYTSLMTTGNLKTFASSLAQFFITKDRHALIRAFDFFAIISSFFIGAMLAAVATHFIALQALYGLPIFLALVLVLTRQNFKQSNQ